MSNEQDDADDNVLILKLMSGDVIVGTNEGIEEDSGGVCIGDPLVMTSTAGYILLTDFTPFLTSQMTKPIVTLNPHAVLYVEAVGKRFAEYYYTSVKYRDTIREDMEEILTKSHKLIATTLETTLAEKKATPNEQGISLQNMLDSPIADAFGPQSDSGDEQQATADDKVVDFNKILNEALKSKKDPLN